MKIGIGIRRGLFLLCVLLLSIPPAIAREGIELSRWKFRTGDDIAWARSDFPDADWQAIRAGKDWEVQGHPGYDGYAWYRVKFALPSTMRRDVQRDDAVRISLGKVDDCDEVFLNGKLLGRNAVLIRAGEDSAPTELSKVPSVWMVERNYDVPVTDPRLHWDSENVLAVRVYDHSLGGGLYASPVGVRMKHPVDYLAMDISSQSFSADAAGGLTKAVSLKYTRPTGTIEGTLAIRIVDTETGKVVATERFAVKMSKGEQTFPLAFEADLTRRNKATYVFVESGSRDEVIYAQALPFSPPRTEMVSGDYYDWTGTLQPEKPWNHDYNRTLVYKIPLGNFTHGFSEALEVARRIDNLTLGLPKIAYLVSWESRDRPFSFEVDERLKRTEDASAAQSLGWLIREARRYHTTVSLHTNLGDIYPSSPLWPEYLAKDIVARDYHGNPIVGESWNSPRSYQLSYAQEWKLGLTQKRIDKLLAAVPELRAGGTIHIDAFHSHRPSGPREPLSPYLGLTTDDEMSAQRKIIRYYRLRGLDVTAEGGIYNLREDPFIGLQAMAWWTRPEDYATLDWLHKPRGFSSLPPQFAGATPMHCEEEIERDPVNLPGLLEQFALQVAPWYYRRNQDVSLSGTVILTDREVISPVLWREKTLIAYRKEGEGVATKIVLPSTWNGTRRVRILSLSPEGTKLLRTLPVEANTILLDLAPGQPVVVEPER